MISGPFCKKVYTCAPDPVFLLWPSQNVLLHLSRFCKCGVFSQRDYHSKYRLEAPSYQPVRELRCLFAWSGILINVWECWALIWMSLWRIKAAKCEIIKWIPSFVRCEFAKCKFRGYACGHAATCAARYLQYLVIPQPGLPEGILIFFKAMASLVDSTGCPVSGLRVPPVCRRTMKSDKGNVWVLKRITSCF